MELAQQFHSPDIQDAIALVVALVLRWFEKRMDKKKHEQKEKIN